MAHAGRQQSPLQLLDLPTDVLQLIIDQVTLPDDLAFLALTNSVLHALVIPRIYSRFHIVWSETHGLDDTFAGAGALTCGLSTLASTGGAILAKTDCCLPASLGTECSECGNPKPPVKKSWDQRRLLRRPYNLAQHVRSFSIANGSWEYVTEYCVAYDSGRLLGTLVALAVARMPKLETFVWDMPTGVLREIWVALASLGDLDDCRLQSLWVRCPESELINDDDESHRRTTNAMNSTRDPLRKKPRCPKKLTNYLDLSYSHIESPSLSLLPPMKSITVVEMDQPAYFQELSLAITTSIDTLRELRISISAHYHVAEWADADKAEFASKKLTDMRLGFLSSGGVLGVVMNGIYDCRPSPRSNTSQKSIDPKENSSVITTRDTDSNSHVINDGVSSADDKFANLNADQNKSHELQQCKQPDPRKPGRHSVRFQSDRKRLRLETLELERVRMCTTVLRHSIRWEFLTSLTLLHCGSDERLWKMLTRMYGDPHGLLPSAAQGYRLSLQKIHTNKVSFALLTFLTKALAPNSLEQLFLQGTYPQATEVTVKEIYRGPLQYHRKSLKKVMIDAMHSRDGSETYEFDMTKGVEWALNRKILSFILSGNMPELRELAMVIGFKHWHFLLQGLPRIPHLRALYLTHARDPHREGHDLAIEFCDQVIDVAALRPEMELAYLAIGQKCFEILENNGKSSIIVSGAMDNAESGPHANGGSGDEDEESKDDSSTFTTGESCLSIDEYGDAMFLTKKGQKRVQRLRLKSRQIPFPDNKVAVFKARHGRL